MKPQLSHVGIYISDTEKMIAFYEEVIGLTVTDRGISSSSKLPIIFMSATPDQHHQFVMVQGRAKDAPAPSTNCRSRWEVWLNCAGWPPK